MLSRTDVPSPETEAGGGPGTLVVVAMETLWPPTHGGRVDRWNRWKLMKALGWRLLFVGWTQDDSHEAPAHREAMAQLFDQCFFFANRRSAGSLLRRLAMLPWHSPHMSARFVPSGQRHGLVEALRGRRPDAVMMDGLYGADLGMALARDLGVPLFYRSHNIEHLYMRRQAGAARGWKRRIAARLAALHIESAERRLIAAADWMFDISADDMRYWRQRGVERISLLPPLLDIPATPAAGTIAPGWDQRRYDAVYLGNLNTPNNVEGIAWFMDAVLPPLRAARPGISILIAGSNPSARLRDLVAGQAGIDLLPNPESVSETRALGRVMINPVLQGSGVNVKSVEMLFTDSPVVTTPVGVQGLDEATRSAFLISDDPAEFASRIIAALAGGPVIDETRIAARAAFGIGGARAFSAELAGLLRKTPR